jgi:ribosomal protein S18 acetylase RimI-like enzyme
MIKEIGEQEFVQTFFALMAEVECGNHFVPENPQHVNWLKERIAVQFFRGTKFFALYGDEGMPIGFAAILVEMKLDKVACSGQYSELLGIAVLSLHRRQGYGSVLLQYAEKYAREAGAYCLYVSTYANDYDVIHFYGKNGFVPVATLPDVHGPNDEGNVYMRKILNAVPRTES